MTYVNVCYLCQYVREDSAQVKKSYEEKYGSKGTKASAPRGVASSKAAAGGGGAVGSSSSLAADTYLDTADDKSHSTADAKEVSPRTAGAKASHHDDDHDVEYDDDNPHHCHHDVIALCCAGCGKGAGVV